MNLTQVVARLSAWTFEQPTGLMSSDPSSAVTTDLAQRDDTIGAAIFATWFWKVMDRILLDDLQALGADQGRSVVRTDPPFQKAVFFIVCGW